MAKPKIYTLIISLDGKMKCTTYSNVETLKIELAEIDPEEVEAIVVEGTVIPFSVHREPTVVLGLSSVKRGPKPKVVEVTSAAMNGTPISNVELPLMKRKPGRPRKIPVAPMSEVKK